MNDLIVIEDKTVFQMDADFSKAEEWARGLCAKYQGLVISENDVVSIKKEMAELNKYAKDIDESRKAIEKKYKELIAPYVDKIKSVKQIFDDTYKALGCQVKAFETAELEKRRDELKKLIDAVIAENDMEAYRADFAVREKWLKKSTSDKSVIADLGEIVERVKERIAGEAERQRLKQERIETITQEAERLRQEFPNGMDDSVLSFALTSDYPLREIFCRMRRFASQNEALRRKGVLGKNKNAEQPVAPVAETAPQSTADTTQYLFKIKTLVIGRENALRVKDLFTQIKAIAQTFENID